MKHSTPIFKILAACVLAGVLLLFGLQLWQYFSDPMTTTDEELFGKWEKNRWAVEPLLDYDRVKGLEKVARAARAGDYPECKRLILSYYNRKFDTFHFDAPRRPDEKNFLCLEMQMENFFVRPKYGPWIKCWWGKSRPGLKRIFCPQCSPLAPLRIGS